MMYASLSHYKDLYHVSEALCGRHTEVDRITAIQSVIKTCSDVSGGTFSLFGIYAVAEEKRNELNAAVTVSKPYASHLEQIHVLFHFFV